MEGYIEGGLVRKHLTILWFAVLLALNYALPYTLLTGYRRVTGAYLFWPLITLIVAFSCFALIRKWKG